MTTRRLQEAHELIDRLLVAAPLHQAREVHGLDLRMVGDFVEDLFDVKVRKVNTMWQRGKRKRVGRNIGTTRSFKKAIVTLEPGHKIDVFF